MSLLPRNQLPLNEDILRNYKKPFTKVNKGDRLSTRKQRASDSFKNQAIINQ